MNYPDAGSNSNPGHDMQGEGGYMPCRCPLQSNSNPGPSPNTNRPITAYELTIWERRTAAHKETNLTVTLLLTLTLILSLMLSLI